MKIVFNYLIYISLAFFVYSCANIVPPDGGPRDKEPPILTKSNPHNNTILFKGKKIELEFNEDINIENIQENILSNPLIEGNIYASRIGKKVSITFEKPLKENTTYHLQIVNCIKDITENNITKKIDLNFSTGEDIDTNVLAGTVIDYVLKKPLHNFNIQLYNPADTCSAINCKPLYISRTDETGNYSFKNLKKGTYIAYVFNDKNKNYLYDSTQEYITQHKNLEISNSKTIQDFKVTLFKKIKPTIISTKSINKGMEFKLNKSIYQAKTNDLNHFTILSEKNKIIQIYKTQMDIDSSSFELTLIDSNGLQTIIPIKGLFISNKVKNKKVEYFIYPTDRQLKEQDSILLVFNKPILLNSLGQNENSIKWTRNKDSAIIHTKFNGDTIYLNLEKGQLTTVDGDTLPKINTSFTKRNPKKYGTISGMVETDSINFVLELVSETNRIIYSQRNKKNFNYTWLDPGSYKLKLIFDTNGNGIWDGYDFSTDSPPEQIQYYKESINLRENWDILDIVFKTP